MFILKDTSCHSVALILSECCDLDTLAGVLDGLLCADGHAGLSDKQARIAARLFDELATVRPQAVDRAMTRGAQC